MTGNPLWAFLPIGTFLAVGLYIVSRQRNDAKHSLSVLNDKGFRPTHTFKFGEKIISIDIANDRLAFVLLPVRIVPRNGADSFMALITETVSLSAVELISFRKTDSVLRVEFRFADASENRLNGEKTLSLTTMVPYTREVEMLIQAWTTAVSSMRNDA